jgi:Transcriptional regulator
MTENIFVEIFSIYLLENINRVIFSSNKMKEEILQAALSQFLKFGIREMSIKKIIEPLSISTKTIYKYFKNKEDLLEGVLSLYYEQQYQLLENLSEKQNVVALFLDVWYSAIKRGYDVNNLFYKDLHYYYPELEKKIETIVGRKFGLQFQKLIIKGINEGAFRPEIHSGVVMEGIYVLYTSVTRTNLFNRYNVSPYEIMINTIVNFLRGICTSAGIEALEKHLATLLPFDMSVDFK